MGESVLEFNFETDRLPSEKTAVGTGTLKEKLKKKKRSSFQAFDKVSLGVPLGQHQTGSEVGEAWDVRPFEGCTARGGLWAGLPP